MTNRRPFAFLGATAIVIAGCAHTGDYTPTGEVIRHNGKIYKIYSGYGVPRYNAAAKIYETTAGLFVKIDRVFVPCHGDCRATVTGTPTGTPARPPQTPRPGQPRTPPVGPDPSSGE